MITIIPIEPLSDVHALLILKALNKHFINKGGQTDGFGDGWEWCYGGGSGGGQGDGWRIDEISMKPTGGHI